MFSLITNASLIGANKLAGVAVAMLLLSFVSGSVPRHRVFGLFPY